MDVILPHWLLHPLPGLFRLDPPFRGHPSNQPSEQDAPRPIRPFFGRRGNRRWWYCHLLLEGRKVLHRSMGWVRPCLVDSMLPGRRAHWAAWFPLDYVHWCDPLVLVRTPDRSANRPCACGACSQPSPSLASCCAPFRSFTTTSCSRPRRLWERRRSCLGSIASRPPVLRRCVCHFDSACGNVLFAHASGAVLCVEYRL